MAREKGQSAIKSSKEVSDLSKAIEGLGEDSIEIDSAWGGVLDKVKAINEQWSTSSKYNKKSRDEAKRQSKYAKAALNYAKKQNIWTKGRLKYYTAIHKLRKLGKNYEDEILDNLIASTKEVKKQVTLRKTMNKLWEGTKSLTKGIFGFIGKILLPLTAIFKLFTFIVSILTNIDKVLTDVGTKFGAILQVNTQLQDTIFKQRTAAIELGYAESDVLDITQTLNTEFAIGVNAAMKLSDEILRNARVQGLAVQEASNLSGILRNVFDLSVDQQRLFTDQVTLLSAQNKVLAPQVFKDIATHAEDLYLFSGSSLQEITKSVIQARRLGMSFDKVASAARGILDFETSLRGELEAEILLGKDLDLTRLRQLAYQKDGEGFAKEMANQLGRAGDFGKMNLFQQEALAQAMGMTVTDIASMMKITEDAIPGVMGGLSEAATIDEHKVLGPWTDIVNQFKGLKALIEEQLNMPLTDAMKNLHKWVTKEDGPLQAMKKLIIDIGTKIKTEHATGWQGVKDLIEIIIGEENYGKMATLTTNIKDSLDKMFKIIGDEGIAGVIRVITPLWEDFRDWTKDVWKKMKPITDFLFSWKGLILLASLAMLSFIGNIVSAIANVGLLATGLAGLWKGRKMPGTGPTVIPGKGGSKGKKPSWGKRMKDWFKNKKATRNIYEGGSIARDAEKARKIKRAKNVIATGTKIGLKGAVVAELILPIDQFHGDPTTSGKEAFLKSISSEDQNKYQEFNAFQQGTSGQGLGLGNNVNASNITIDDVVIEIQKTNKLLKDTYGPGGTYFNTPSPVKAIY